MGLEKGGRVVGLEDSESVHNAPDQWLRVT